MLLSRKGWYNIVKGSSGSTFNRGDFTITNAFLWSSLDLSPYAGTDLGSTPYYIELLDSAGKKATGYIGAVGAGETHSEKIVNGDNEAAAVTLITNRVTKTQSNEQKYAGTYSAKLVANAESNIHYLSDDNHIAGVLYKANLWIYLPSGQTVNQVMLYNNSAQVLGGTTTKDTWINQFGYQTGVTNGRFYYALTSGLFENNYWYVDNISNSQVTDPPSTAVHIVSSLNGTTRNWASIESGFNPNNIASWNIFA